MDAEFRTLLITNPCKKLLNLNVFFDVLLAGTCLAPGYFIVRTLHQISSYEELNMLREEWMPTLMAGLFFVLWVLESSYFDYMGVFTIQANGIKDATLFASVSIFAIGTARFAETWGGYVKGIDAKRKMMEKTGVVRNPMEDGA